MNIHPDDTDEDYAMFGRIVLLWGRVEAWLVTMNFLLLNKPNDLPSKGIPQNFDGRIKLAQKGYQILSRYSEIRGEALGVIELLAPLHKERTVIVHGLYNGKSIPDNSQLYVFGLVKWGKGSLGHVQSSIYSRQDLIDFTNAIADASKRMEAVVAKTRISTP